MKAAGQTTDDLATTLFDKFGRLQRIIILCRPPQVPGVWAKELDRGDILVIEDVWVDEEWRRKGLMTKLLTMLMTQARLKVDPASRLWTLVRTDQHDYSDEPVQQADDANEANGPQVIADSFFQSLGFSGIRTTPYLAYADHPTHRSRTRLVGSGLPSAPRKISRPNTRWALLFHRYGQRKHYPEFVKDLDAAIATTGGYREYVVCGPSAVLGGIFSSSGNTILHELATDQDVEYMEIVMSKMPWLAKVQNDTGLLPSEYFWYHSCQRLARSPVPITLTRKQCRIMCLLQGIPFWDVSGTPELRIWQAVCNWPPDSPENTIIRANLCIRYGCTCGCCINGFLSPRMRRTLSIKARELYNRMKGLLSTPVGLFDPLGIEEPRYYGLGLQYLPRQLILLLQAASEDGLKLRAGFRHLFGHFANCTQMSKVPEQRPWTQLRRGHLPSPFTIYAIYDAVDENYFVQMGGSVEMVGNIVFREAWLDDELLGSQRRDMRFVKEWEEHYKGLPECHYDKEYRFVAEKCGYMMLKDDPVTREEIDGKWVKGL